MPPRSLLPEPYILSSQDHNGLNDGILIFRPTLYVLVFIEHLIQTLEAPLSSIYDDQCLLSQALLHDRYMARHFYEFPKIWFNAYSISEGGENEPQMEVHLVSRLKHKVDWLQTLKDRMKALRTDTDWQEKREKASKAGRDWWERVGAGIEKMRFLLDC